MAKTVDSVALDNPASDPNINEGGNFSMDGTTTLSGSHTADYDAHHQYDQGIGSWIDIPSSGSELTTASTNPELNITGTAITTATINGVGAGTYSVRIRVIDHNNADAAVDSGTQTVTVNVPAAGVSGLTLMGVG